MIDHIERLNMPCAIELEDLNRAELNHRLLICQLSHDRSNHAAMGDQQGIVIATRRPNRVSIRSSPCSTRAVKPARLSPSGIGVIRRQPIGVPDREVVGIALANLVGGETLE